MVSDGLGLRPHRVQAADFCDLLEGSNLVKAGWSFDKSPRFVLPPVMSRYRDRKLNKACQFIGYDSYVDATTRGQLRYAFDPGTSVVGNWDVMEGVLDYLFIKLGVDGANGGVDRPIVMTEPIANLAYPRRSKWYRLWL
jgi:actin-related protein 5